MEWWEISGKFGREKIEGSNQQKRGRRAKNRTALAAELAAYRPVGSAALRPAAWPASSAGHREEGWVAAEPRWGR
ncbi:hypothetical protein ES705_41104 [subsurface metagenome]